MEADSLLVQAAGSLQRMKTCASSERFQVFVLMANLAMWTGLCCFLSHSFWLQILKFQFPHFQMLQTGCVKLLCSLFCVIFINFFHLTYESFWLLAAKSPDCLTCWDITFWAMNLVIVIFFSRSKGKMNQWHHCHSHKRHLFLVPFWNLTGGSLF